MSNTVDIQKLIGARFGKLIIVRKADINKYQRTTLYCRCDCGNYIDVTINALKTGNTTSCGCNMIGRITHGLKKHPLYMVWNSMKQRCSNPKKVNYKHYGGRGIKVCQEWEMDFLSFYNWCMTNGWVHGLEIDRKDNNGNYEPDNCRIATRSINMSNTRVNRNISYNGEVKTLTEWASYLGVARGVLHDRIVKLNQPIARAFTNKKYN